MSHALYNTRIAKLKSTLLYFIIFKIINAYIYRSSSIFSFFYLISTSTSLIFRSQFLSPLTSLKY